MTPLPKHLQPRWRYLGVGVTSWPDAELSRDRFQRALWRAARTLLGDVGSAGLDLQVIHFEYTDGQGEVIVRTHRGETDRARAVLACVSSVDEDPIGLRIRGVSGTIRACEEKYIGREPEGPSQSYVAFENAERRAVVRGDRVDVRIDEAFAGATDLDLQ